MIIALFALEWIWLSGCVSPAPEYDDSDFYGTWESEAGDSWSFSPDGAVWYETINGELYYVGSLSWESQDDSPFHGVFEGDYFSEDSDGRAESSFWIQFEYDVDMIPNVEPGSNMFLWAYLYERRMQLSSWIYDNNVSFRSTQVESIPQITDEISLYMNEEDVNVLSEESSSPNDNNNETIARDGFIGCYASQRGATAELKITNRGGVFYAQLWERGGWDRENSVIRRGYITEISEVVEDVHLIEDNLISDDAPFGIFKVQPGSTVDDIYTSTGYILYYVTAGPAYPVVCR